MNESEEIEGFVLIPKGKLKKVYDVCDCLYSYILLEFLTKEEKSEYYPEDDF